MFIASMHWPKDKAELVRIAKADKRPPAQLAAITAPSGTVYIAIVTARCLHDGPVTAGKLQTFEFNRYKGNLSVTTK